jgi:mannose-6-phosphate isomerase-like protein (cupin superfamily)
MEETRKGYILPIKKITFGAAPEGNSKTEFYDFLRRETERPIPGAEPSTYIKLSMNKVFAGGGVEEHYHEPPIVDHVYYVISGRILATVGDQKQVVGADTLIYCPSSVRHSITNVGKTVAKVISIDASAKGVRGGAVVYSKPPTGGNVSGNEWKVAGK